jgi:hypothetical protein
VSAYNQIRKAVRDGLHLDNLQIILRTSYKIIEEETPKHPAALLLLAVLARWGVESWGDDEVIPLNVSDRIESTLKSHLEAVLDVLDSDAAEACSVLDRVTAEFYKELATAKPLR